MLSACETKDVLLLILSECYYEEPYAGKPHVRICEGLKLQGFSLLDCISKKTVKSNSYEDKSNCCVNYGNRCVTLADELPKIRVQN